MSEELSQEQIEEHNRRDHWREVQSNLRLASEIVEQTQGSLEDLVPYEGEEVPSRMSEALEPLRDSLMSASTAAGMMVNRP
jgi:hypothetical protein